MDTRSTIRALCGAETYGKSIKPVGPPCCGGDDNEARQEKENRGLCMKEQEVCEEGDEYNNEEKEKGATMAAIVAIFFPISSGLYRSG